MTERRSAAIPISAAAGVVDAATNTLLDDEERFTLEKLAIETVWGGAFGVAAGGGGSDFVKGGKVLNEAKAARIVKATKGVSMKAKKRLGRQSERRKSM